ncbi:dethiobiotin synthase [Nitrospira moscoviensis]|uniref:ATP-dependent dethiobiotin synthetase BioD n=1 Tax=Nitrospira moscoviensis TaxID=42253 RepID=A0A0K2GEV2_NITMO|nr:dethiobiotin synthase [Nitrospira moscoviensis]ALA59384.1 Dethiobiotin synthetase [Nitrospira moscoviensis]
MIQGGGFCLFITGTDTAVGKTETACALLSLLADAGLRPAAMKPYESGCLDWHRPADALALKAAARCDDRLDRVCLYRYRAPLAPGVAAARRKETPSFARVLALARSFRGRPLVIEGAGGLFVPIDAQRDIIDLIETLNIPVLLVARAGLGTLNHTGLSLDALASRRIPVRAVLLTKTKDASDPSEGDNAAWLKQRHGVPVLGPVPYMRSPARRLAAYQQALYPILDAFVRPKGSGTVCAQHPLGRSGKRFLTLSLPGDA